MTLHEYRTSRLIEAEQYPFYAVVMAAMRQADSLNVSKLRAAFPDAWDELQARYDAPRGILPSDEPSEGT